MSLIFFGPVAGEKAPSDADATFEVPEGDYGWCASGDQGDFTGDGYRDLGCSWRLADELALGRRLVILAGPIAGATEVASAVATIEPEEEWRYFAWDPAAADFDADGFADVAAGAPALNESWANALSFEQTTVHVFYGPFSGTRGPSDADVNVVGDVGDMLGAQLAVAGDMDADGLPDLLVSGPGDDEGGEDAGAAWLLSGAMLAQGR